MEQPLMQLLVSFVWGGAVLFGYITGYNSFPPALDPDEEKKYLDKWKEGSREARNVLIERNLRLVAHIAKKYTNTYYEMDDLISIGTYGLTKAVNTYKHDKNIKLVTYASRCIENQILMHLRSNKKFNNEVHLMEPIGADSDGNELTWIDLMESDEKGVADTVERNLLSDELKHFIDNELSERERQIINKRYGLCSGKEYTQNEIAYSMGISRSYVSRTA